MTVKRKLLITFGVVVAIIFVLPYVVSGTKRSSLVCRMSGGKPVSGGVSFSGDSVILCARPYADGGNACRSSGECDGRCVIGEWKDRPIFHFDPNYYPKNAVGHCDYYDQQPNCLYNVELLGDDRVLQVGWCIVS